MSDTTDTSKPQMPANFLADQLFLDDFVTWLKPKILMIAAIDGNAIGAKTLAAAMHVVAMEVVDAIEYHEAARTPWGNQIKGVQE